MKIQALSRFEVQQILDLMTAKACLPAHLNQKMSINLNHVYFKQQLKFQASSIKAIILYDYSIT